MLCTCERGTACVLSLFGTHVLVQRWPTSCRTGCWRRAPAHKRFEASPKFVLKSEIEHNHWYANAEIPTIAKKFIKEDLMSWKDKAVWNDKEFFVEYELESFWGNDIYDATGKNVISELGPNKTQLTLTCDLVIHPNKVPGVPKFLVKKVLPAIEGLIQKVLQPNLTSLGKGLNEYFKAQK